MPAKQPRKKTPRAKTEEVGAELHNPIGEQLAALRAAMPHIFTEGKIDPEKLRQAAGEFLDERPERYSFTWAGRRDAIRLLQTPTRATLVPCREESVNFDTTQNLFLEGDNLEVMKVIQKSLARSVKAIIIDPPYNTGNDLIYPDNFADPLASYLQATGQQDADGNILTSNPETDGRFHSTWLTMIYPRLFVARQLLSEEGVIFVCVDDHEMANLRLLLNEVFGEENFIACLIWQKMDSPSRNDEERPVSTYHDYILVYARNKNIAALRQKAKPEILSAYPMRLPDGRLARLRQLRKNGKGARRQDRPTMWFPLEAPDGTEVWPIAPEGWEGRWVLSEKTWDERVAAGLAKWVKRAYGWVPYYIELAPQTPTVPWPTMWTSIDQNRQAKAKFTELMGSGTEFTNPKPCNLIQDMLRMATEPEDSILDFFAGSGSTADATYQLNNEDGGSRRFILVQLPEPTSGGVFKNIAELAKERIRRAGNALDTGADEELDLDDNRDPQDIGFRVFKLAESHFRRWRGVSDNTWESAVKEMELFVDPLLEGWKPDGVLYEVILREGLSLTSSVTPLKDIKTNSILRVEDADKDQSFLISLDDEIKDATLKALKLGKDDRIILRDVALSDTQIANLALQCRLKTI